MEFDEMLEYKLKEVQDVIDSFLPAAQDKQKYEIEAMRYSVEAGGKRIRPMIMLESYRLCGGCDETIVYPYMAAIEFIHTYSLVHDDLPAMDNDEFRRGKLTTHKKFGEDFGVLAGDGLLNYAYEVMLSDISETNISNYDDNADVYSDIMKRKVRAASIIAGKSGIYGMVGGQSLDVLLTGKPMTPEDMQFIFDLKTGALIEASFMAGAILAGADDSVINKMEKVGHYVGLAFQIKDDILDVVGNEAELGKPVLSDEKNNKTTYVTLYGLEKAENDVKELSEKAEMIIKETGNNPFLEQLINGLVNRKK